MKETKDSGITLIALVVTIIVLLILAAVSLSMLTGKNGIIQQARDAKEQSEIDSEKEILELATVKAIGGNKSGNLVFEEFDQAMQSYIDKSKYSLEQQENGVIKVTFTESGRYYYVSADGNVTLAGNGPGTGSGNGSGTGDGNGSGSGSGSGNPPEGIPGTRHEEETKVTIDGKPVTIPGGATISGVDGENTIEGGLVIYIIPPTDIIPDWSNAAEVEYAQKTYSQFVWVPVENAVLDLSSKPDSLVSDETIKSAVNLEIARGRYPMAIKKTDGNYIGVLYEFNYSETEDAVIVSYLNDWSPLGVDGVVTTKNREPHSSWRDSTYSGLKQINGILQTTYEKSPEFDEALQTEFNIMVERVKDNKGFWIGRYETSGMSDSTTLSYAASNEIKINVVKGASNGVSNVSWHRMYAQQKIYTRKADITGISGMIWGSQWDQVMIWMKQVKNISEGSYFVVNSKNMGWHYNKTGSGWSDTGFYSVKNVYDLAKNFNEFTMESYSDTFRVTRSYGMSGETDGASARRTLEINQTSRRKWSWGKIDSMVNIDVVLE